VNGASLIFNHRHFLIEKLPQMKRTSASVKNDFDYISENFFHSIVLFLFFVKLSTTTLKIELEGGKLNHTQS
jgi:hypothetical protein